MTQQAFSLARQKVKREAFQELFQASVEGSYNETLKDWRGWLLFAIDGIGVGIGAEYAMTENMPYKPLFYGTVGALRAGWGVSEGERAVMPHLGDKTA
jgi:hypothetical protein